MSITIISCDTGGPELSDTYIKTITVTDGSSQVAAWSRAIAPASVGAVVAGVIQTTDQGQDIYVARLDKQGQVMWAKMFGGKSDDKAYDIIRTQSGDFVITGIADYNKLYLLRIDGQGSIIWEHTYQRIDKPMHLVKDYGFAITETNDGGFVVAGRSAVPWPHGGGGNVAPSVLHVDANGERLWFKQYLDKVGTGRALSIAETSEGSFIITGLYDSSRPFKITSEGTFKYIISDKERNVVYGDITILEDGSYIVAGDGFGSNLIRIAKIRPGGEIVWSNTYGYGYAQSLTITQDGGIVVAGSLWEKDTGDQNIYLFKVDASGKVLWKTTRDLLDDAILFDVKETSTGTLIATGRFTYHGWNIPQYPIILRADAQGNIGMVGSVLGGTREYN